MVQRLLIGLLAVLAIPACSDNPDRDARERLPQQIAEGHLRDKYQGTSSSVDGFSESFVPEVWSVDPYVWCYSVLLRTSDTLGGPLRESTYTDCQYLASGFGYDGAVKLIEEEVSVEVECRIVRQGQWPNGVPTWAQPVDPATC